MEEKELFNTSGEKLEELYQEKRKRVLKVSLPSTTAVIAVSVILFIISETNLTNSLHVSISYIVQTVAVLAIVGALLHLINELSRLTKIKDARDINSWLGKYK